MMPSITLIQSGASARTMKIATGVWLLDGGERQGRDSAAECKRKSTPKSTAWKHLLAEDPAQMQLMNDTNRRMPDTRNLIRLALLSSPAIKSIIQD